jgi:hypothetical protein
MKYLISIGLILITTVTFLYYLFNNPNFLPINDLGEYNWINILTLIFLVSFIIFSLLNLLMYSVLSLFKRRGGGLKEKERVKSQEQYIRKDESREVKQVQGKKFTSKEKIIISFKFSLILTIGFLTVFILNFFHILNWIWGLSILVVVLIFIFII